MERCITFLLGRRWMVLTVTTLLVAAGWMAWTRLPIDAFPDVTNVQVMVLTEAPGLSAVDVEQQITYPIEQQMGGVPHVTRCARSPRPDFPRSLSSFRTTRISILPGSKFLND